MLNALRYFKNEWLPVTTELWKVGIAHQSAASLCRPYALQNASITWLPNPGNFRFIADPFGLWYGEHFIIFVEALDYRVKKGEIHYYRYDRKWVLVEKGVALRRPYHLSYPTILRDGDSIYMLPEASKSGKLTLYRAVHFPVQWEEAATLLDQPAIDASVIYYENRWWMFYALPGNDDCAMRELNMAYADNLTGPWMPHTGNPVRSALDSARPGGMPFIEAGTLYLPTQDGTVTYGGALQILRIDRLTPTEFAATITARLSPHDVDSGYTHGLHTLSGEANVALIDVKKIDFSKKRRFIDWWRRISRCWRREANRF